MSLSPVIEVNGEVKDFSTLKEDEKMKINKQLTITILTLLDVRANPRRKGGLNL